MPNQSDIFIVVLWGLVMALGITYSFIYLSVVSFKGTLQNQIIAWTYENLDPEWRSINTNLQGILIYVLSYMVGAHIFQSIKKPFIVGSGLILMALLSRWGCCIVIIIMTINYIFAAFTNKYKEFPKIVWIIHLTLITIIHCTNGLDFIQNQSIKEYNNKSVMQWHYYYVWSMLRMISYNFDSINEPSGLLDYFSYMLYPPLYYSGPLIGYLDFKQQLNSQSKIPRNKIFIIYGLLLYAIAQIMIPYALANHVGNLWVWQNKITAFPGICLLLGSLLFVWMRYAFIWSFQQCWASWDNINVDSNCPKHLFLICSAKTFSTHFCATLREFLIRYLLEYINLNKHITLCLVYCIVAIMFNVDHVTIWFYLMLLLFALIEQSHKIINLKILYLFRVLGQLIILFVVMCLYTTNLDIMSAFLQLKLYWIPALCTICAITQLFNK